MKYEGTSQGQINIPNMLDSNAELDLEVETGAISSPTSVNVNYRDRQIAFFLAKKIEEDRKSAEIHGAQSGRGRSHALWVRRYGRRFCIAPHKKRRAPVVSSFGNGLIQYGTTVYPGLFGDSLTPGFDISFNFAIRNLEGLGMNIKYKGLAYDNNRYTHGILIGLTISPSEHNK